MQETWIQSLGWEDPLEKEMAIYFNISAWEIPWTEEPGGDGGGLVAKSCPILVTPWTVACQTPLSMGFSRQEYLSGLPFPSLLLLLSDFSRVQLCVTP